LFVSLLYSFLFFETFPYFFPLFLSFLLCFHLNLFHFLSVPFSIFAYTLRTNIYICVSVSYSLFAAPCRLAQRSLMFFIYVDLSGSTLT
jgi:hypothetical protein